jgi:hypothetical protein
VESKVEQKPIQNPTKNGVCYTANGIMEKLSPEKPLKQWIKIVDKLHNFSTNLIIQ